MRPFMVVRKGLIVRLLAAVALTCLSLSTSLYAQFMVDCTGTDPSAYHSINAALANVSGPATIIVGGSCNESVNMQALHDVSLGAAWNERASITGGILVSNSQNIYLYGLNVSNPYGNGIEIGNSRSVVVDSCTSNGNAGKGLQVGGMSEATVIAPGAFNSNSGEGIRISDSSSVTANAWTGAIVDISHNSSAGVWVSGGQFTTLGNTTITNNIGDSGLGVDARGASRLQFGTVFGPNILRQNQAGGCSLLENSEASFWDFTGTPNVIQANGPIGVSAGFGSQVTFYNAAQITDHSGAGIDLYANSQAYLFGANQIQRNGSALDPLSAGIRVDGNSEAFLRGGDISQNIGPGVLALVNSSVDFTGLSVAGNSGGLITCDSTATMISDLAGPNSTPPAGVRCKTPHGLGNRKVVKTPPSVPSVNEYKALQAKYRKIATKQ